MCKQQTMDRVINQPRTRQTTPIRAFIQAGFPISPLTPTTYPDIPGDWPHMDTHHFQTCPKPMQVKLIE